MLRSHRFRSFFRRLRLRALAGLCLPLVSLVSPSFARDRVETYATPGAVPSDRYEVTVVQDGIRRESIVYKSVPPEKTYPEDDGGDEHRRPRRSMSWTTFSFAGQIAVEVRMKSGSFRSAVLRPRRYGLVAERIDDRTLRFPLDRPGRKISVEFDGNTTDAMLVFADSLEDPAGVPSLSDPKVYAHPADRAFSVPAGAEAVYFGPGLHAIGYWKPVGPVKRVYLAGGAYVYGAIAFGTRDGTSITGRGVLSGEKFPWRAQKSNLQHHTGECWTSCILMLEYGGGRGHRIEGVTIANTPYYTMDPHGAQISIRDVKILGNWLWNTDGIDVTSNGPVEDCFIQANDDMLKIYRSDATVRNCVCWHMHNGPVVQMGWTVRNTRNIKVSGLDVIHSEWIWSANGNNGAINFHYDPKTIRASGTGTVEDAVFENITMEGRVLRAVGLLAPGGQTIRNMVVRNLSVDSLGGDSSGAGISNPIRGIDGGSVRDITFDGMRIGGILITEANAVSVGRFAIDPGSTRNIRFTNTTALRATPGRGMIGMTGRSADGGMFPGEAGRIPVFDLVGRRVRPGGEKPAAVGWTGRP